jgi:hypothetical protein
MVARAVRAVPAEAEVPFSIDPASFGSGSRRRLSGPGLRAFLNIAEHWGLGEGERLRVLGLPGRSTYYGWLERARRGMPVSLGLDTLLRLSAVLGIHKALRIVFIRDEDALRWLRSANRDLTFGGQRPIDLVTSGTQDGLLTVRRYLDAWRGGGAAAPNEADRLPPMADDDIVIL